jgi:hypothetical protein
MASEFDRRRVSILAAAVTEILVKNVASLEAQKSGNPLLSLVARVAANVSSADTRSWTALPKEFQVLRIAAPNDGHLVLASTDGSFIGDATVPTGRPTIVWVKAQCTRAHPAIQVFQL